MGDGSGGHAGDAVPAAESAAPVGGEVEGVVAAVAAASYPVAWARPNDRFYMAPDRQSDFPASVDAALAPHGEGQVVGPRHVVNTHTKDREVCRFGNVARVHVGKIIG